MGNKRKWYSVLLIGLVLLLASSVVGCRASPAVESTPPVIIAFSATPNEISASESATLLWNVTEATTVSIDQGIGDVPAAGTKLVSPTTTTTYTLTATNTADTITESVVITVAPPLLPPVPSKSKLKVHFIDVGQGDSILVDLGETEVLIDGGDKSPGVVAYLNDFVDGTLEVMVATHPHADHIGGLIGVLDAFEVDEIWLNGDSSTSETYSQFMSAVDSEGAQVYEARRGDTIQVGDIVFDVLHPDNLGGTTNNNSIVLSLSYGEIDFLFTGDAEQEAESSMLRAGIVPDVEILKVGHHGSRTASSSQFLQVAKPECAIYMAGKGNSYGHPHQETIDALAEVHALTCGTDQYGTIIVTTDGSIFSVEPPCSTPPPIIEVINLSISPDEVEPGETVTISATIKNSGGSQGSYEATLTVNDTEVETKSIVLNAGESEIVEFTLSYQSTGTYMVEVNGSEDTFTVIEKAVQERELFLEIVFVTTPIGKGYTATLRAKTVPEAYCTIVVYYKSGPSKASGLYPKEADSQGDVSWSWKVGTRTTPGSWPIVITASLDGDTVSQTTSFAVY